MDQLNIFRQYQPILFSIAYRMLGNAMEAEDMVQEAFLRWQKETDVNVRAPKAYLTATITRLCIDYLRLARVKREEYIGPWLPEPLLTDSFQDVNSKVELNESLSLAFLLLMENLRPIERAVFLLHEVFAHSYTEIAEIVEKSEANCRQILHRARRSLKKKHPRHHVSAEEQKRLFSQFLQASRDGDMQGLLALLADDIMFYSDGGGKASVSRYPIQGSKNVASFIMGLLHKAPAGMQTVILEVNAQPALIIYIDGRLYSVLMLNVVANQITDIYFQANPEKLTTIPPQR